MGGDKTSVKGEQLTMGENKKPQGNNPRTLQERWRHLCGWPSTWGLFRTVGVMIIICLGALAVAWWLWGLWAKITTPNTRSTVSLATVGGLGGLVALVVSYRKQAMNERNEVDGKLADAVHLLGDPMPSTRIAGVYALANAGDRYPERQQQIVDILCGYLRTKREDDGPTESTIIATLKSKLNKNVWTRDRDIDLDLHDVILTEELDLCDIKIRNLVFMNAVFNNYVEFNNAVFNRDAAFHDAVFNRDAAFIGTVFNRDAIFMNAKFNDYGSFGNAVFNRIAMFESATFKHIAAFGNAIFDNTAIFDNVTFRHDTEFESATFNSAAIFDQAVFNSGAKVANGDTVFVNATFKNAVFNGDAEFESATFKHYATFDQAVFNGDAKFTNATFKDRTVVEKIRKDAVFNSGFTLKDVKFEGDTDNGK